MKNCCVGVNWQSLIYSRNIPATPAYEVNISHPGVILGLVSSIVMFWTEVSCWRKRYSDKTTLFLRWNHCFKNYTVVIANWSIVTKYPILKWHFVDYVFTLSPTRLLQDLTGVIIGVETAYPSEHMSLPPVFSGVRVIRSSILYLCFVDHCCPFVLFILAILLPVFLLYTNSDYPFGIFELFFSPTFTGFDYMSNTVRMSYKKHELLTLHEHLSTLVGSVLIILSVFWFLFLDLFVFVLCLVYNVACVFRLHILECPFGFL